MRRRGLRWIVVAILIAFGFYVVADVVMLQYMQSRGGTEIARAMTAEEAKVDLGGFPFLPGFLTGGLDDVEVTVNGASAPGGLRIQKVVVRMQSVDFSPRRMFSLARSSFATRTTVKTTQPFGMVEIAGSDLQDFIKDAVPLVDSVDVNTSGIEVRFVGQDELRQEGDPTDAGEPVEPARYLPQIRDGELKLIATSTTQIPQQFRADAQRLVDLIDLPQIPAGLSATVRLGDDLIVVEASGTEAEINVGEGQTG